MNSTIKLKIVIHLTLKSPSGTLEDTGLRPSKSFGYYYVILFVIIYHGFLCIKAQMTQKTESKKVSQKWTPDEHQILWISH